MLQSGFVLILCVSCLLARPVLAVDLLDPVSQNRHVAVAALAVDNSLAESDQDADSLAAPAFGLFDFSTEVSATITHASASCSGSQTSEILSESLQASGSISAIGNSIEYEAFGQASGTSRCEVTFDVTSAASFTLSGSLGSFFNGTAAVTLEDSTGTIVSLVGGSNQTTPVLETGSLDPGTYTFVANASGTAFADFFVFFTASASYDLLFELDSATSVDGYDTGLRSSPVAAPNPFRHATTISWSGSRWTASDVRIFDVQGRLVRTLTGSESDRALSWDGRNAVGEVVRPGVYFLRLEDGGKVHRLKLIRVR